MSKEIKWKDASKETPNDVGIYIVARFDNGEMVEFSTDYVWYENHFQPNRCGTPGFKFTHWMSYDSYRKLLEQTPR